MTGSSKWCYEGDRVGREQFEAVALGAHARLDEERRGILDDLAGFARQMVLRRG